MTGLESVRRFARATNLAVAGRRFRVTGDGPDAREITAILTALGARVAPDRAPVDHLWCTGSPDESADAVRQIAAAQPLGHPLVVVDAGSGTASLDLDGLGAARPVRPGVVALLDVSPDVFAVPAALASHTGDAESSRGTDAAGRIAWARRFMPVSAQLADELGQGEGLYGLRIAVSMVLEPKTAVLALLLRDAGAVVDVYAHADETDDAVAEALRLEGVDVFASSTATLDEARTLALDLLDRWPDILLDDGSHVIRLAHIVRPELLDTMIGAAEETTSGLRPLRVMEQRGELRLPIIEVNDARMKSFFDNRYGTGQSCVFAILDAVEADGASFGRGATAAVAGFGPVGEGTAQALRATGFRVVVAEIDPVRALQAAAAGYDVAPLVEAVRDAALVVSATGVRDTISAEVLGACTEGAVVAVAGGVDHEVAVAATGHVRLLADGSCVNIALGEGNPIEIMDYSFAVQLAAVQTLLDAHGRLSPGLHPIAASADRRIAETALDALGLSSGGAGGDGAGGDGAAADADDAGRRDPAPLAVDTRTTRFGPLP